MERISTVVFCSLNKVNEIINFRMQCGIVQLSDHILRKSININTKKNMLKSSSKCSALNAADFTNSKTLVIIQCLIGIYYSALQIFRKFCTDF